MTFKKGPRRVFPGALLFSALTIPPEVIGTPIMVIDWKCESIWILRPPSTWPLIWLRWNSFCRPLSAARYQRMTLAFRFNFNTFASNLVVRNKMCSVTENSMYLELKVKTHHHQVTWVHMNSSDVIVRKKGRKRKSHKNKYYLDRLKRYEIMKSK